MLPRTARLSRRAFPSSGYKTVRTPYFSLKVKKNSIGRARLAVVVGVSVNKSAVFRNTLRREMRAIYGMLKNTSSDYILIASSSVSKLSKKVFLAELKKIAAMSEF